MESEPSRPLGPFLGLVLGLHQAGMVALGKLVNPVSGKTEADLDAARGTIDTLAALADRTRGNLESDEARALQQALTALRINYLEERKRAGSAAEPAPGAEQR